MDKQTRMQQIIERVKEKNGESVKALALQFGVTEMTVRRDIGQLKAAGLVRVVAGAVLYSGDSCQPEVERYELDVHNSLRTDEKHRIGKLAAALIQPDDVLYFDVGTTTPHIISHLPDGMELSAVCCTVNALNELQKKGVAQLIVAGGTYRPDVQMFESKEGVALLARTRISKAFISAAGVSAKLGVTCVNSCEVEAKCAVMKGALENILVADSSKFDAVKPAFFAPIDAFQAVVTDDGLSPDWKKELERRGIQVYLA